MGVRDKKTVGPSVGMYLSEVTRSRSFRKLGGNEDYVSVG